MGCHRTDTQHPSILNYSSARIKSFIKSDNFIYSNSLRFRVINFGRPAKVSSDSVGPIEMALGRQITIIIFAEPVIWCSFVGRWLLENFPVSSSMLKVSSREGEMQSELSQCFAYGRFASFPWTVFPERIHSHRSIELIVRRKMIEFKMFFEKIKWQVSHQSET